MPCGVKRVDDKIPFQMEETGYLDWLAWYLEKCY
jgi:hypothetical protein